MYLFLLVVSLGLLLLGDMILFGRDYGTPAMYFTLGFFLCALNLCTFIDIWDVHIHATTFWLILGSNVAFSLLSYIYKLFHPFNENRQIHFNYEVLSVRTLKLFLVFQIASYCLQYYFLASYYGQGSIAANLVTHTAAIKFDGNALRLPPGLPFIFGLNGMMGNAIAFLLPMYIIKKKKTAHVKWLAINFSFVLIGSLLSSGRSPMLAYIIVFATFYVVALQLHKKSINLKRILILGLTAYVFLLFFQRLGFLIGREDTGEKDDYVVGVYLGAQIQNLDDYLESPKRVISKYPGEITFQTLYDNYSTHTEEIIERRRDLHSFNIRNGYSLGNVSSCLQDFYYDFGFGGTIALCGLLGWLTQCVYVAMRKRLFRKGYFYFYPVLLYGSFIPMVFMSFFGVNPFDRFSTFLTLRFWLGYFIVFYVLYRVIPFKRILLSK